MKNWSIKWKLGALSAMLLTALCAVGVTGYRGSSVLGHDITDLTQVEMPASRSMGLLDMMHDGMRAVVYRSLFVSESSPIDREQAKEVAEELQEFSANIAKYLKELDDLPVRADVKKAISEAQPGVVAYSKSAEELVGLALSGQRSVAIQKLDDFNKNFTILEEKLGSLGELVEKMSEESAVAANAEGDFYKRLNLWIVAVGLACGLFVAWWMVRDLTGSLSSVIDRLTATGGEVSSASGRSSRTANSLSEAATEQASGLQETMASIEEISAMVNQNAESALRAKASVEQSENDSRRGTENIEEMLVAIGEIKRTNDDILAQMESSNREFGNIVKIITEIGEKTKVINDIVFQTKLLSFNASVEAARAGEHGKGFAVVAEEVGNLAQMSGNAAKEITDMLGGSVKKVNEIVEQTTRKVDSLVEVGRDKIALGQTTAQKCRDVLNQISLNAKTVSAMVAEITNASKEQAQGVQEINKAIAQLDQVTQQNTAVAQESATQSNQLQAQAEELGRALQQLTLTVRGADDGISPPKQTFDVDSKTIVAKKGPKTGNVIPIRSASKAVSKNVMPPVMAKKAVGSDVVPSGDDPNFEEF